ncbi:hypothetical protein [Niallia taxi]|uniref:Uncharacterized protein n=1 Tax=Niallia taxi TaxID=2499688 RepID=A0A437K486_9BACI|nr:hypothetical protein [Niallia taxi]RVT57211.1 hypothetical protein EM808_25050 [Niallia taxi]
MEIKANVQGMTDTKNESGYLTYPQVSQDLAISADRVKSIRIEVTYLDEIASIITFMIHSHLLKCGFGK